ncbi:MAG TPA: hypothetical protein GXX75_06905 [Clostridiales bacterium]|nr:hypothetical protein [Clostridiales bacterium]
MSDLDALEVIRELKEYNHQGLLLTPASVDDDPLYACALSHAIRALEERCGEPLEWKEEI